MKISDRILKEISKSGEKYYNYKSTSHEPDRGIVDLKKDLKVRSVGSHLTNDMKRATKLLKDIDYSILRAKKEKENIDNEVFQNLVDVCYNITDRLK